MAISVRVDLSGAEARFSEAAHKKRQVVMAERAAFMMRKYVPVEESTLRDSEPLSSDYEAGRLIWNTPYAAKHYYVPMHHTEAGTTDHWDVEMVNREGGDLTEFAKKLYEGGGA